MVDPEREVKESDISVRCRLLLQVSEESCFAYRWFLRGLICRTSSWLILREKIERVNISVRCRPLLPVSKDSR